jgi:hypothetical protein
LADGRPIPCADPYGLAWGIYAGSAVGRRLCAVTLHSGVNYSARVVVQHDTPAWRQSAPRFAVRLDTAAVVRDAGMSTLLPLGLAGILALASVLTFAGLLLLRPSSRGHAGSRV